MFKNIIQSVRKIILLIILKGEGWHYIAVKNYQPY